MISNKYLRSLHSEGLGSRATSRVTFRDGDGHQHTRGSSHPTEGGEHGATSAVPSLHSQRGQQQSPELKKKEEINPFKFSPNVDFCALSQLDKREKARVKKCAIFPVPLTVY